MDSGKPTARDALMAERFDLEPEPEPTVHDVLEGIAEALEVACELAEPKRTAARCLTVAAHVRAATGAYVTADELLANLRRLVAEWTS